MPVASTEVLPDCSSFPLQQDCASTALICLSPCFADLWSSLQNGVGTGLVFTLEGQGPITISSEAVARALRLPG